MPTSSLDYFSGGVPTGAYFYMTLEDITKVVKSNQDGLLRRVTEISYIGLLAYFEAFCKDHFASIISIEPSLLKKLRDSDQSTRIDACDLLESPSVIETSIGFLVAENFDFGTASKINSLYFSILKITPFSKDEKIIFDKMQKDRNCEHIGAKTYPNPMG